MSQKVGEATLTNKHFLYHALDIKFYDITDMFHKYRSRSPEVLRKNGFLDKKASVLESLVKR